MTVKLSLAPVGLAFCVFCGPVTAQESADWVFQLTPYAWATNIEGNITPFRGAHRISFNSSFSEILEDLDAAVFLSGSARRDRFVVLGDFSFAKSSKSGHLSSGIQVKGELDQMSMTLVGGYQAVRTQSIAIDLMAGARHWRIKGSVAVPAAGKSVSPSLTFTDPVLALQANVTLNPKWSAQLYGDIGGFGVGSKLTSQLVAALKYQVRDDIFVSAGYRTLSFDYREGGSDFDITMSGPVIGAIWRF